MTGTVTIPGQSRENRRRDVILLLQELGYAVCGDQGQELHATDTYGGIGILKKIPDAARTGFAWWKSWLVKPPSFEWIGTIVIIDQLQHSPSHALVHIDAHGRDRRPICVDIATKYAARFGEDVNVSISKGRRSL